jgi:hypothetical protein
MGMLPLISQCEKNWWSWSLVRAFGVYRNLDHFRPLLWSGNGLGVVWEWSGNGLEILKVL